MKRVLIIGGYGNFGRHIATLLAREDGIQLIIGGRDGGKAARFAATLPAANAPESAAFDLRRDFDATLGTVRPDIVIHTSGPFQDQGYGVAEACIRGRCHYIDLADGRDFVCGIGALDAAARAAGILVCAGASSVPCLTAGLVDKYRGDFARLDTLDYGIATAHLTNRGLATTSAVLSYAGKPFKTLIDGRMQDVYGWLGLHVRRCRGLGRRLLGDCDIPDLSLFPERYPDLVTIRFRAGLEIKVIHLGLYALSWLVRLHVIRSLRPLAGGLLRLSRLFDPFGRDDSGFYFELSGDEHDGAPRRIVFELTARGGDGLYIPSMAAILLARKLADGTVTATGAMPCIGLIGADEYLAALAEFRIDWTERIVEGIGTREALNE